MKIIMLTAAVALFVLCGGAWAGGPLVTVNGRAVVYSENDFPVPYSTDRGSLGSLGNAEATQLVDECFQVWEDVQTSTIMFRNAGQLREDVRLFNYLSYLDDNYDGINPIVFDDDGTIIDAYFGSGQSSYVIGFAGSAYYDSGYSAGYYIEGQAVLNGIFSDAFSYEQFKATFVHEFGHFFGLDHCQINSEYVADGSTVNDAYVPTMYPTATDDDTTLGELNPDDVAAVTMLYPASNVDSYYGRIEGTVIRADGSPVLGANVVAVQVGDEQLSRFSSVSDYYMRNTGAYDMLVTPGSYKLFMEPIDETFTSGSSVGPYAQSAYDQSFIEPVIVEYYNGASESSKESDLNAYETITVSAGETVTGIGFVAEGEAGSTTTTTTIDAGSTTTTTISGDSAVSVAFSADPLSGAIPLTVEFSNQTTGLVDYYLWDFGDGSISLEENTFHTYTSPGLFTVTLTANASDGTSETLVKEHYVSVSICSFRSFVADRRQLAALHKVRTRLAGSPSGAFLIGLYYCYTAEISSVLVLQPALQQKVEQLIEKNIAYACKLANVGTVVVPAAGMRELQEVLQELGSHGGTGLRAALAMIRASLKSETFLASLGVLIEE